MKINLSQFEKLENQKAELRNKVHLPPEVKMELAFDAVHGLNDLTRSLAELHPHKRSIAVLGSQPPPLREIMKGFSGQGYSVQELPVSFTHFEEHSLLTAWSALKKDTLFVVTSAVEPLTGALYPYTWVRQKAAEKNIFTLIYLSPDALKRGLIIPSSPFEGVVADPLWGEEHTTAVILKGERCQGEPLIWGEPTFSEKGVQLLIQKLNALKEGRAASEGEDIDTVKKFEKEILAALNKTVRTIGDNCRRLYDRSVFFIPGVNGEALMEELKKEGFESATGASCYWKSPHQNTWLPKLGFSAELVEGSLIIPITTLKKPGLKDKLVQHINELRKISNFKA